MRRASIKKYILFFELIQISIILVNNHIYKFIFKRNYMKKLLLLITLTLAMSLLMVSCGDDDETTGPSTLKIGEMNAKVGGADFKAQNAIYYNIPRSVAGVKI